MRRLLSTFIDAKMRPRMRTGKEQLEALRERIPHEDKIARNRVDTLLQWQDKTNKLLPFISKFLG